MINFKTLLMSCVCSFFAVSTIQAQQAKKELTNDELAIKILHTTTDADLREWMTYLTSEECAGRLTGSEGFQKSINYAANLFKEWGLEPGGDNGTYFHSFKHPYILVKEGAEFVSHYPIGEDWVSKTYAYPDDYMPGGTSDSGEVKDREIVYVGYGISAPDLNYDDYSGIDVKGKIVVIENGYPYSGKDFNEQIKWRPYLGLPSKMINAKAHGAAGVLLTSTKAVVSAGFNEGLLFAGISETVVEDFFAGTGKSYKETKEAIRKELKPHSFSLGKKGDLKAVTEYHPEGVGYNVIGVIKGTDPKLAPEVIMAGGHIDHVGCVPELISGAFDNGSGTVITMGAAKALATSGFKPKRTLIFILFGAEENGLNGSQAFLDRPTVPLKDIKVLFNTDMLAMGDGLMGATFKDYGSLLNFVQDANNEYVKRPYRNRYDSNQLLIPRTDGLLFLANKIPSIGVAATGFGPGYPYHHPDDNMSIIDFSIVTDGMKLLTMTLMKMANAPKLEAAYQDKDKK